MAKKKARSKTKGSKKSSKKDLAESSVTSRWHAVPLKGSFMVLSILGFLISAYMINNRDYRITFMIVFGVMFVASLVSMTKAPIMNR